MDINDKLKRELRDFSNFWKGGTTLSRQGWSTCARERLKTGIDINKIYQICIQPYINSNTTVLEIGTNGGGWLSRMLEAKRLIGLDALSADHTGFWKNVPKLDKISYHYVLDFSCDCLEEDSIDFVFSYDVFCHISFSGTEEYLKNLYNKLKPGANGFIMIADSDKYQNKQGRIKLTETSGHSDWDTFVDDFDGKVSYRPGRWYFYDTERFCKLLEKYNYILVDKDVIGKYDAKSPIIHFKKPDSIE
jgi:hypothetical protein